MFLALFCDLNGSDKNSRVLVDNIKGNNKS